MEILFGKGLVDIRLKRWGCRQNMDTVQQGHDIVDMDVAAAQPLASSPAIIQNSLGGVKQAILGGLDTTTDVLQALCFVGIQPRNDFCGFIEFIAKAHFQAVGVGLDWLSSCWRAMIEAISPKSGKNAIGIPI